MRDTIAVAESSLSLLRLFNDERYFWLVLIPKLAGAVEWFDLPTPYQQTLLDEALACGKVIGGLPETQKVNLGALGNVVPQLHIHVVGRHAQDPAWPGPVWGHSPAIPLTPESLSARVRTLKNSSLDLRFSFSSV